MIHDQLDRMMFLERRFGVLMQFVQYVTERRGLAVDQGFETLVQLIRCAVVAGQVMFQLALTALRILFELLQVGPRGPGTDYQAVAVAVWVFFR
ncbi:hypothetical protein [Kocuria marina]|uniref:hypothetical protein n=1 Tax=Kocuria marina TaxID=223184 RepID=UPI00299F8BBC|nr:hypothetical protein [Kocuria marina]